MHNKPNMAAVTGSKNTTQDSILICQQSDSFSVDGGPNNSNILCNSSQESDRETLILLLKGIGVTVLDTTFLQ